LTQKITIKIKQQGKIVLITMTYTKPKLKM